MLYDIVLKRKSDGRLFRTQCHKYVYERNLIKKLNELSDYDVFILDKAEIPFINWFCFEEDIRSKKIAAQKLKKSQMVS